MIKPFTFTDVDKLEAALDELPSEMETLKRAVSDLTRECYDLRAENRHISHQRNDCTRALRDAQERISNSETIDALRNENYRLQASVRRLREKRANDHAALTLATMGRMRKTLVAIETAAKAASDARRLG